MVNAYDVIANGDAWDLTPINQGYAALGRVDGVGLYPVVAPRYTIHKISSTYWRHDNLDGVNDDSNASFATLAQAAINDMDQGDALALTGQGPFDLSTTTLNLDEHGITLQGVGCNLACTAGSVITYSGTGSALYVRKAATRLQHVSLRNIGIMAEGAAITAAVGRGIWVNDVEDLLVDRVVVRDFEAGLGTTISCSATSYVAEVKIRDSFFYENKFGVYCDGDSGGNEVNTVSILNTPIIGKAGPTAGSVGVTFDAFTNGCLVLGGDVETYETAYEIYGDDNSFLKTRTEDIGTTHFLIQAGANDTYLHNHTFNGGGAKIWDLGTDTHWPTFTAVSSLDLSGGATDILVYHAPTAGILCGYTLLYTEASSGDAGVTVEIGRYQDGVALDDDYFDQSTSELTQNLGYAKTFNSGDLTQYAITKGDVITAGTAGGKVGTGEVLVILKIFEV